MLEAVRVDRRSSSRGAQDGGAGGVIAPGSSACVAVLRYEPPSVIAARQHTSSNANTTNSQRSSPASTTSPTTWQQHFTLQPQILRVLTNATDFVFPVEIYDGRFRLAPPDHRLALQFYHSDRALLEQQMRNSTIASDAPSSSSSSPTMTTTSSSPSSKTSAAAESAFLSSLPSTDDELLDFGVVSFPGVYTRLVELANTEPIVAHLSARPVNCSSAPSVFVICPVMPVDKQCAKAPGSAQFKGSSLSFLVVRDFFFQMLDLQAPASKQR